MKGLSFFKRVGPLTITSRGVSSVRVAPHVSVGRRGTLVSFSFGPFRFRRRIGR